MHARCLGETVIQPFLSLGRGGGPVTALAINPVTPSTLYAGTDGGVFKSTDGGASWTAVNTNSYVQALAINPKIPSTLYAGTGDGAFESTDSGASWIAINTGLTKFDNMPNFDVRALAIDPMTPSTLYAGTFGGGGVFAHHDEHHHHHAALHDRPLYLGGCAHEPGMCGAVHSGTRDRQVQQSRGPHRAGYDEPRHEGAQAPPTSEAPPQGGRRDSDARREGQEGETVSSVRS
jgi:hypothetical protein